MAPRLAGVLCDAVVCSAVQCSAVQCSAVLCGAVRCDAVLCGAASPAILEILLNFESAYLSMLRNRAFHVLERGCSVARTHAAVKSTAPWHACACACARAMGNVRQ